MQNLSGKQRPSYKRFYPSVLLIALCSHYAYYYLVFRGDYGECLPLVLLAITCMILGYAFGSFARITVGTKRRNNRIAPRRDPVIRVKALKRAAIAFLLIGIGAHLFYYSRNPIASYAGSYTASRGSGYVTVFFNFWLLGMVLLEYLSLDGETGRFLKFANRLLILIYTVFYVLLLMKRRQIIMLFLALFAIWGTKMPKRRKVAMYVLGAGAACIFMIMGRARGYIDHYGFFEAIPYILEAFSTEWLALEKFEGRYISRTLNHVRGYVETIGHDSSIIWGVLFCMVPRKLLGGQKPLAFPEWYTKHFYPTDFARGTGYAGSMVAELYLIGGIPLLIFGYLLIGYISARIHKNVLKQQNSGSLLVYSLFIYTILLLPRYDLASLLIDAMFLYLPLILICGGRIKFQAS